MSRTILLGLLATAPGCGDHSCPDIGCNAQLVLTIDAVTDVSGAIGTFAVGGGYFSVDCSVESPNYDCSGNDITLYLGWDDVTEPVDVTWSLQVPAGDGAEAMAGEGTFRPDWEAGEYQDSDCLPGCWFGAGTLTVAPAG